MIYVVRVTILRHECRYSIATQKYKKIEEWNVDLNYVDLDDVI